MIEEPATVVKTEGHTVWLESASSGGCGQCSQKAGCGQTVFSELFGIEKVTFKTESKELLNTGDQVLLGIDEKALVRGSALVYMLPILVMIFLAVIGAWLSRILNISHEGLIVSGGLIGLYLGFRYSRRRASVLSKSSSFQPVILKTL